MLKEGIINFLKPAGMTSHDAVYALRRTLGVKRIGHTGTLDPMAVGVLPLGIGSAARITEYLDLDEKTYRCQVLLGLSTDTLDVWGKVLEDRRENSRGLREEDVLEALAPMRGSIMQLPPKYSALRVNGRRLYDYARNGEEVEIARRPVHISALEVVDMDLKRGRVTFDVTCSKGTYVRSICQELGETLGCGGGAMSFLLRLKSGAAELSEAVTLEELREDPETVCRYIGSVDRYLPSLGVLRLRPGRGKWFSNGGYLIGRDVDVVKKPFIEDIKRDDEAFRQKLAHLGTKESLLETYLVYEDSFFYGTAIYHKEQEKYKCDKVFYR